MSAMAADAEDSGDAEDAGDAEETGVVLELVPNSSPAAIAALAPICSSQMNPSSSSSELTRSFALTTRSTTGSSKRTSRYSEDADEADDILEKSSKGTSKNSEDESEADKYTLLGMLTNCSMSSALTDLHASPLEITVAKKSDSPTQRSFNVSSALIAVITLS